MPITTIPGSSKTDQKTLLGTDGNDSINIKDNRLFIETYAGYDTIMASNTVDNLSINSGINDDYINFSSEILESKINFGQGNDIIDMQGFSGSIYGGSGEDTINHGSSYKIEDSLLRGNSGDDDFNLYKISNSIVNVNADDDEIMVSDTVYKSEIYGGRQQDTIEVSKVVGSLIRGDANEDQITVSGSMDSSIVNGNANNDILIIKSSSVVNSKIYGGNGNDNIDISSDAILVYGNKGNDNISLTSSKKHTVYGGKGNDEINANSIQPLYVDGGADNDIIVLTGSTAVNESHTVNGGSGDDHITGTSGTEILDIGEGNSGNDTLVSNGGNDSIYGQDGNDQINIVAGSNSGIVLIEAGRDDDIVKLVLAELTFQDTIRGEDGEDTLAVVGNSVDFNMWETNTTAEKAFDSITSFETLSFGSVDTNYTISGTKTINLSNKAQSAGISTIDVSKADGRGDDVLEVNAFMFTSSTNITFIGSNDKDVSVNFTGGSGDDTLTTGKITEDDSDTLTGGPGQDTFNIIATDEPAIVTDLGQGGADTLIVDTQAKGVIATVKDDYIAPSTSANNKSLADVVLNANSGVNVNLVDVSGTYGYVINGGLAASTLQGSSLNDSITGNSRADSLVGNGGHDTITGGGGADRINAGRGNGYIKDAGIGADIITHSEGSSLVIQNTGSDLVTIEATRPGLYLVTTAGVRNVDASSSTASIALDGSSAGENKVTYTGGAAADTIKGSLSGDLLTGNGGNDTITGGLAADTINVGGGSNSVVFTSGLSIDKITSYTANDVGAFDLSELETDGAVEANETLNFVTASGIDVLAGDSIGMQTVNGPITLDTTTNVLKYTHFSVPNAAALETRLETQSIITSNAALDENDAFLIQYINFDSNTYSYAIAHLEDAGIGAGANITNWEVTDIATTDYYSPFGSNQFSFIA